MAIWSWAAERDLEAIWLHQSTYSSEDYADRLVVALLRYAPKIEPTQFIEVAPDIHRVVHDGYVFLVMAGSGGAEILRLFAPGQNWTAWLGHHYPV